MTDWVRAHLFETMLPFWARRAFDPDAGGFVSALSQTGERLPEDMRACLVQSRCLYSFSHAAVLTGEGWAIEAAERAYLCLISRFRHRSGLWVTAATPREGGRRDERLDFYDQAFMLFSLGWWARIGDRNAALTLAEETFAALEQDTRRSSRPAAGGRTMPPSCPAGRTRICICWKRCMPCTRPAASPSGWRGPRRIVSCFCRASSTPRPPRCREFLTADLDPATGDPGRLREPGHAMEWVWLLLQHHRLTGNRSVLGPAHELYRTARRDGCDASGHLVEVTTRRRPRARRLASALAPDRGGEGGARHA